MTFLPSSISFCRSPALQARVQELSLNLTIVIEVGERARVGDECDDERPAERGLAECSDAHARTGFVERREVVDDLLPAWQVPVSARFETENRRGGWDSARRLCDARGSRPLQFQRGGVCSAKTNEGTRAISRASRRNGHAASRCARLWVEGRYPAPREEGRDALFSALSSSRRGEPHNSR